MQSFSPIFDFPPKRKTDRPIWRAVVSIVFFVAVLLNLNDGRRGMQAGNISHIILEQVVELCQEGWGRKANARRQAKSMQMKVGK